MKILSACTALLAASLFPLAAAEAPADPLTMIKSLVKDPAKAFGLVVEVTIKPESEAAFRELAKAAVDATRQEPGNVAYEVQRDAADPTKFFFIERWKNIAAVEEHLTKDYVKNLLAKLPDLTSAPPVIHVTHSYLYSRGPRPAARPESAQKPTAEKKGDAPAKP